MLADFKVRMPAQLILLLLFCLCKLTFVNSSSLILVQSLFRHGDRNPASTFVTDTGNRESTWKNGFGELTEIGIAQQYELGKFVKRRYKDFLSEKYDAREIHVRSTGFNRTIMSALANMAGMFPPVGDQIWNSSIPWQPVPVHSRPKHQDPMLWMDKPCKTVSRLYQTKVFTSEPYQKVQNDNVNFIEFVRLKTGRSSLTLMDFWGVYDSLNCEAIHNDTHKWPDWVNETVFQHISSLYRTSCTFYYNIPEVQRFRGAMLFNEVAGRMMEKIANESDFISRLKYYAYSIHDTTQSALLENLKVFDTSLPVYNQILFFELHENNGTHFVKLFKRNDTRSDDIIAIEIPECGKPCLASKLFQLSQQNVPKDWDLECDNVVQNGSIAVRLLAALSALFFLLSVCMVVLFCRLRRPRYVIDG